MEESSSSKPFMVTSSLNFKVTTPSFYNQPKKFASVAPPRSKSVTPPSAPSPTPIGTAVIGRVGDLPPPPPSLSVEDLSLPAPPDDFAPPPAAGNPQRLVEKQTSFDQQLDTLTDLLSEMETRGPFNPKIPSQYSSAPATAPKPPAPPPTAPKPSLSFLPPPEMGDRPPPAPWAEELKARTNRHANNHNSGPNSSQPLSKAPAVAPKAAFGGRTPSPSGPVAIPGGGVPLNMREVEELERMTKDFIRDMDTNAPVITSPPTELCGKCGEALSRTQPAVRAMEKLFHSDCFCCLSCQRPLQGLQFYDRDGAPQCDDCYTSSLAVCSRCGERITDRVLKAVGQCFHSHCFRCSTCSCSLEGAPFITDDNNNPYCVPDYHRRFSPQCVSCNEPIVPSPGSEETVRVVALDKNFHLKCYRCEDCARPLSIEADENGCYPLDGKILCMKCHTQRAKQAAQ
ncbi:Zyxin [Dissostichus eleginoides]|uniref:Zyxin n=1 Tax=Dissostichus eleginoides TaxID=100907 RepID=A0AAD9C680_DISEL|nr:Zyxin [Dissostichus eleginoides]